MGDPDFRHQHQDERERLAPPPLVFLRRRPWPQSRTELRTTIHWSPRIELRLMERAIEQRHTMVERIVERHVETRLLQRERLAMQLVERRARAEELHIVRRETLPPAPGAPRTAPSSQPPEMKLSRPQQAAASETRAPERSAPSPFAPFQKPAAAPIDLNGITDSVMRQIDRRMTAHRERMWRK